MKTNKALSVLLSVVLLLSVLPIGIWTKADSTNLALGKPVEHAENVDSSISTLWTDTYLTDGVVQPDWSIDWVPGEWLGYWWNTEKENVHELSNAVDGIAIPTIDLGGSHTVERARVNMFLGNDWGISPASLVELQVSSDGVEFVTVATAELENPPEGTAGEDAVGWVELVPEQAVEAQYVRIAMTLANNWLFVDEIEVYGTPNFDVTPPEEPVLPEGETTFWVTHYNNSAVEGAGVIFTEPYEYCGWWLHVAFAPINPKEHVYEIVAIRNGLNDGSATPLDIPDDGFVWAINSGNNYPALGMNGPDYTSPNTDAAIQQALNWNYYDRFVIHGIDFETVPTSTPGIAWYHDAYVCTALIEPYVKKEGHDPAQLRETQSFGYSRSYPEAYVTLDGYDDFGPNLAITPTFIADYPVKAIAAEGIADTYIRQLIISDGVKYIGDNAMRNNRFLQAVFIPSSVTQMGASVFAGCEQLENIYCMATEQPESWDPAWLDGCNATVHFMPEIPADEKPENYTFWFDGEGWIITSCVSNDTDITVPATIADIPVKELYPYSFSYLDKLQSITIPGTVETVGERAFAKCNALESVTTLEGVQHIDSYAFSNCDALISITLSEGITSIGDYSFYNCDALKSISLPSSLLEIGESAFGHCQSVESLQIDENNPHYVGEGNCLIERETGALLQGFNSSVIPEGVKTIAAYAFVGCDQLTSIVIPDGVIEIAENAFSHCDALEQVVIPDSVTLIGYETFAGCAALKEVIIPDSVTTIDSWAFMFCTSLTSITIPDSVTTVGWGIFDSCESLTDIYVEASEMPAGWTYGWIEECGATVHWGYQSKPDVITGDCNGDGAVNGIDATRLLRYLASYNPITGVSDVEIGAGADCNGDGTINGMDATRLLRYLASYNPITGKSDVELG